MKKILESFKEFAKREFGYGDSMDIDNMINDLEDQVDDYEYNEGELQILFDDYIVNNPSRINDMINANMFGEYDYIKSIVNDIILYYKEARNEIGHIESLDYNYPYAIDILTKFVNEFIEKNNLV